MLQDNKKRIEWVDYAKGITIILVVQLHVTFAIQPLFGLDNTMATHSFAGMVVEFFRSFRMPLFFLVAGLFLANSINKPWMEYLDKKVLHFAYFYILWSLIEFSIKSNFSADDYPLSMLLKSVYEPFSSLWFIYMLAIFFTVTRLLKNVPMPILMIAAIGLFLWQPQTNFMLVDEFAHRYVFFLSGFIGSRMIFKWADLMKDYWVQALLVLALFSAANLLALYVELPKNSFLALLMSYFGALSVIALCAVFAHHNLAWFLKYIGQHTLYIYLSFFVPAAAMRIILMKTGWAPEINTFAFMTTAFAVVVPIIGYHIIKNTPLNFVFIRPKWFHLDQSLKVKKKFEDKSTSVL